MRIMSSRKHQSTDLNVRRSLNEIINEKIALFLCTFQKQFELLDDIFRRIDSFFERIDCKVTQ